MSTTETEIKRKLLYDEQTGLLLWAVSEGGWVCAGREAGSLDAYGYRVVRINNKLLKAHRIAWFMWFGEFPKGQLDHINGNKLDNRIANLREVSYKENAQNKKVSQGVSGSRGADFCKKQGKWRARISVSGKTTHLGLFTLKEEAENAYTEAKRQNHPFCNW